jgi:Ca2+-binding EF-hand superfamily protein
MTGEPPRTGKRVKKSDTLQVRIPHETKQAFTDACREDDVAVSDRIRGWIESFLFTRQQPSGAPSKSIVAMIPKPFRNRRYLAAGAVALGATVLLALPSAANTTFRSMFEQLDANHDGNVTEAEFMAMTKKPKPMADFGPIKLPPEVREGMITSVRETLGKPLDPYLLPPRDPGLWEALERGERTLESLSDEELERVIPLWDEKNHPVSITLEQQLAAERKLEEEALKQFLAGKASQGKGPTVSETCSHAGISDAEFANPWMNSNALDMHRMFKDGDRNKDGVVVFEEFQLSQTETARIWFGSMDTDSDSRLTMQDFIASQEKWVKFIKENPNLPTCTPRNPKPRWLPLDANRDGAVTFEEYLVPAQLLDPR